MTNPAKIGFFSTIMGSGTDHGYGYTAVQLIEAWQRQGVPVWWADETAPIAFSYIQPPWFEHIDNRINIGYVPWESTKVPASWIPKMNMMQEIWTPSNACKQWFTDAGVTVPIRVLAHGINKAHWPLQYRSKRADEPFRFLHVGGEAKRKGAKLVYDCFKELFADRTDVILVLKAKKLAFKTNLSNVHVIEGSMPQADLTKLFLKCHCMLYPTQGEGFGLIPQQAIATGMPTFVTDWSGPQDFTKYAWPIKVKDMVECDYEPHEGTWALPDEQHLMYKMRDIVDAPSYYFKSAFRKASQLDTSWDSIAKLSLGWMGQLLETR